MCVGITDGAPIHAAADMQPCETMVFAMETPASASHGNVGVFRAMSWQFVEYPDRAGVETDASFSANRVQRQRAGDVFWRISRQRQY